MGFNLGTVASPGAYPVGSYPVNPANRTGEMILSEMHGKFFTGSYFGNGFNANVAGITIPAIASGVVGTFALVNPASSNVTVELVSINIGLYATATVESLGWYAQNIVANAIAAQTTPTTGPWGMGVLPAVIGGAGSIAPKLQVCTGLTAKTGTTPTLVDVIGSQQSTSALEASSFEKIYDGRKLLAPGTAIWLCGTAAGPTSGAEVEVCWMEWPNI